MMHQANKNKHLTAERNDASADRWLFGADLGNAELGEQVLGRAGGTELDLRVENAHCELPPPAHSLQFHGQLNGTRVWLKGVRTSSIVVALIFAGACWVLAAQPSSARL
eukprot:3585961-Heterocapsa_arctica.AAC.1